MLCTWIRSITGIRRRSKERSICARAEEVSGQVAEEIRIAERIATLDILSGGRVNWGSGKSSSKVEQLAFENDTSTLHEQWLEALEMIPRMWRDDVFEWKGRFFNIPPTQVIPKPVQEPHPPIFAACTKPDSAATVGELGIGALNFALGSDTYLREKLEAYRRAVEASSPSAYSKTNHFACTPSACILPDDRKACEYGFRGSRFFQESLSRYYFGQERPVGRLEVPRDFFPEEDLRAAMEFRQDPDAENAMVIGDPIRAREAVQRFVDAGVDELILVMQMGTVPHELVMESIRTFADEVMPEFHGREAEHQEWKRAVLAGELELEEVDTDPYNFRGASRPTIAPDGSRTQAGS